jgi:hypothetical protein
VLFPGRSGRDFTVCEIVGATIHFSAINKP